MAVRATATLHKHATDVKLVPAYGADGACKGSSEAALIKQLQEIVVGILGQPVMANQALMQVRAMFSPSEISCARLDPPVCVVSLLGGTTQDLTLPGQANKAYADMQCKRRLERLLAGYRRQGKSILLSSCTNLLSLWMGAGGPGLNQRN